MNTYLVNKIHPHVLKLKKLWEDIVSTAEQAKQKAHGDNI